MTVREKHCKVTEAFGVITVDLFYPVSFPRVPLNIYTIVFINEGKVYIKNDVIKIYILITMF